jgi:23S rRNA pseudouridine2605 synthase
MERLQKILANAGICSRRKAEKYIIAGRIKVNGIIIKQLGHKADLQTDKIEFDNNIITPPPKLYYLLNKPKGYVTTLNDPQGRPVVSTILKTIPFRLIPVGRLDFDTEGALIMTNDGELAQKITHPSYEINKTYQVIVKGSPAKDKLTLLSRGIELEGQTTYPAKIKKVYLAKKQEAFEITIHEGRKRQVRKMFAAIGHPVLKLTRIAYGKLKLGKLGPGKFRKLSKHDLKLIF